MRSFVLPLAAFAAFAGFVWADPPAEAPIVPDGIRGALVLCGGGPLPESIRKEFVELAGGEDAKLVVIPTACDDPDLPVVSPALADLWKSRGIKDVTVFHTRAAAEANDEKFVEPLRNATAVWIGGGKQTLLAAAYSRTRVERELQALLERGGVIGGTSAGAACQSKVMIVRAKVWETPGFDLIPGVIVDQHFLVRNRKQRLLDVLAQYPTHVGFGVDEAAALVVRGRSLKCVGDGTVTLCLAASKTRPVRELVLKPGQAADLTALRRAARDRQGEQFPAEQVGPPAVNAGSLVIVGGGGMPVEVVEKFIELAGGPDAPIVVLPTATEDPSPRSNEARFFERFGAKHVKVLAAHTPAELADPAFLAALGEAKGVWFGGGRQWRFVDAYEGTPAVEAFHAVLKRGGVIGGSSAGATIQGEYLVRGSPLGNTEMMAEGYERGFGFLPGAAIDQHFTQRKRSEDLKSVIDAFPQLLGIGIDESTALIVRGSVGEVLGEGKVFFCTAPSGAESGAARLEAVSVGEQYNLQQRRPVKRSEPNREPSSQESAK